MAPPPPDPAERPRAVGAAFYCWLAAAILLAATGLLMVTWPPSAYKVAGVLFLAVGLVLALLAGRARKRDVRSARAALGLAMAAIAFIALVVLFLPMPIGGVVLIALTVFALIAGSVLNQRPASHRWFHPEGAT